MAAKWPWDEERKGQVARGKHVLPGVSQNGWPWASDSKGSVKPKANATAEMQDAVEKAEEAARRASVAREAAERDAAAMQNTVSCPVTPTLRIPAPSYPPVR